MGAVFFAPIPKRQKEPLIFARYQESAGGLSKAWGCTLHAFHLMGAARAVSDASPEFQLSSRVSREDLQALQTLLRTHADKPVAVSARHWRSFDTLTLQFLLAASKTWTERGLRFALTDLSADMAAILGQIGVGTDMLTWEDAR